MFMVIVMFDNSFFLNYNVKINKYDGTLKKC